MDTIKPTTPDAERTAGSLHREGYAALVESWRACAKSLAENYPGLRACAPDAADRAIARAEIYAQCAERLEQEMRHNEPSAGAMSACENIDGQCGSSWCDCDYQRRKNRSLAPADGSANPTRQPCKTCRYFHSTKNAGPDGWCESIKDDVKSWWTGCVRHSPNAEPIHGKNDA